ncbi:hypothetical protein SAMN04488012_10624 [Palleronia salina]|uniref:Uncharacterized protein n=1 Tax=Palleronia salina TaxID=313368 RepID=A0A1M6HI30_9RHOB|nr:hypothetical protein [Palleronia salina]SHJ21825.1 hypothetical protein SAMN04488012_10624 [Palleronia salina]
MSDPSDGNRGAGRLWLAAVAVTILAGVVVPYAILGPAGSTRAVPVFWTLFGLVVIGLIVAGVARWRDEP